MAKDQCPLIKKDNHMYIQEYSIVEVDRSFDLATCLLARRHLLQCGATARGNGVKNPSTVFNIQAL